MFFLGIDQGTSGTTVAAFDEHLRERARSSGAVRTFCTAPGRAEQNASEIVSSVVDGVAEVLHAVGGRASIAAVGLANQGESILAWDTTSDWTTPVVLWSDDRGREIVDSIRARALAENVHTKSGLPLSPYFSAAKISWLLRHDERTRRALGNETLRVGTLDSYLSWELSGRKHVTDHGTASRTQLFDLSAMGWDAQLLEAFSLPANMPAAHMLADIRPSLGELGTLQHSSWGGPLPWRASLVDQPAALAGNGCFSYGDTKITYGTGCFVVANAGTQKSRLPNDLAFSFAWTSNADRRYAIDGGVFAAGSALRWLMDIGMLASADDASRLALSVNGTDGIRFLPALQGLGAPWWRPRQRAVLDHVSAAATPAHIIRAVLDGIAFRVCDIVRAAWGGGLPKPAAFRIDGGLSECEYLMQRQADVLGMRLECGSNKEATVLGAAALAGIAVGAITQEDLAVANPARRTYEPRCHANESEDAYQQWLAWLRHALSQ